MKQVQKISDAEMEVMKAVWQNGGAVTSAFLHHRLGETKEWKLNTVITFLARLTDKGLIRAEKQGRGKPSLYIALLTEEEYKRCETVAFLNAVHGGSVKSLLTALCGEEAPSRAQLKDLQDWFDAQGSGKE